jgi:hypothetical protein
MRDAELRERFDEWAAPLRAATPPAFGSIRRRSRARMARFAAATGSAAAVVALAIVLALTGVVGGSQQPNPWGSGRYPAPPSQPYVFVNISLGPIAQVRNASTGAVVATLRTPGQNAVFGAAAAAASDRLFVVSESTGGPGGAVTFADVRLVAASHRHVPLVVLSPVPHIRLPSGTQVNDLAVSPAGTRVAVESQNSAGAVSLSIYNLLTGSLIGGWPGVNGQFTMALQFLPDDDLVVPWLVGAAPGPVTSPAHHTTSHSTSTSSPAPAPSVPPRQVVQRVVNPAVPFRAGSSFVADSLVDPGLSQPIGTPTADGTVALLVVPAPGGGRTADVLAVSEATGKRLYAVPIGPASDLNNAEFCGILWASADGRDLLTQCGSRQEEISDGKATVVRLAWKFPFSQIQGVTAFAW